MHIKNSFFRFIVSGFLSLTFYVLLVTYFEARFALELKLFEVIESMFSYAIFGFFIVVPSLLFITYLLYVSFTEREKRSKKTGKRIKIMIYILAVLVLLHVVAYFL